MVNSKLLHHYLQLFLNTSLPYSPLVSDNGLRNSILHHHRCTFQETTYSRQWTLDTMVCTVTNTTLYVLAQGYAPWLFNYTWGHSQYYIYTWGHSQYFNIEHVKMYALPISVAYHKCSYQSDSTVLEFMSHLFWMDKVVKLPNKLCTLSTWRVWNQKELWWSTPTDSSKSIF